MSMTKRDHFDFWRRRLRSAEEEVDVAREELRKFDGQPGFWTPDAWSRPGTLMPEPIEDLTARDLLVAIAETSRQAAQRDATESEAAQLDALIDEAQRRRAKKTEPEPEGMAGAGGDEVSQAVRIPPGFADDLAKAPGVTVIRSCDDVMRFRSDSSGDEAKAKCYRGDSYKENARA